MGPLHTVNKSPYASTALESCLARLTDGAALLLLEDGVYGALAAGAAAASLTEAARHHMIYVLAPDVEARGLGRVALLDFIRPVDYLGFVDLVASHSGVVAWF